MEEEMLESVIEMSDFRDQWENADKLIAKEEGNAKKALAKALAYLLIQAKRRSS
jgi:hypothetical protein